MTSNMIIYNLQISNIVLSYAFVTYKCVLDIQSRIITQQIIYLVT